MTAEAKKIFEQALALPSAQRAALIDALSESIVGEDELSPEWKIVQGRRGPDESEIARRIEAVECGESSLIPGDEVETRIQAMLGRL